MTDFLARLAARAAGRTPVAQPRRPPVFADEPEPPELEAKAPELEAIGDRSGTSLPPELQRRVTRAGGDRPVARGRPAPAPEPPAGGAVPPPTTRPPSARLPAAEAPVVPAVDTGPGPPPAPPAPPVPTVPAAPVAAPVGPATAPAARPLVPAVPRVAAAPPVPPPGPDRGPRQGTAATDDEPAVRIHIGRLEVRANLQAPRPPERRDPRRAEPEPLALSDYLRGDRQAR